MKTCAHCTSKEVVFVLIKKDRKYLNVEWLCTDHMLQLIQRMNTIFPALDYVAKIREAK